jgi:toxin FitB
MFAQAFAGRILPFDEDAAHAYAAIVASRNAAGSQFDAMIARTHRATVATRNIADFDRCGVQLVDPWKHRGHRPA